MLINKSPFAQRCFAVADLVASRRARRQRELVSSPDPPVRERGSGDETKRERPSIDQRGRHLLRVALRPLIN